MREPEPPNLDVEREWDPPEAVQPVVQQVHGLSEARHSVPERDQDRRRGALERASEGADC